MITKQQLGNALWGMAAKKAEAAEPPKAAEHAKPAAKPKSK